MRTKLRPRYYCDHCNRAGGSAHHMRKHEAHCTANPERACGLCKRKKLVAADYFHLLPEVPESLVAGCAFSDDAQLEAYKTAAEGHIERLRSELGCCPACTLAVIRQSKCVYGHFYQFKDDLAEWWKYENEVAEEARRFRAGY